ncbi:MAG: Pr6Pr family membrane protein [Clostridia bacterium]|nr:Pr6Pr family membrane protein [Clostridia bacterium]
MKNQSNTEQLFTGLFLLILAITSSMFLINRILFSEMSYDSDSINILSYFTIQTNIISTIWMLVLSLHALTGSKIYKISTNINLAAAVTTYILVAGIIYWAVLVPVFYKPGETWLFSVSNIWMHTFVPAISVVMLFYAKRLALDEAKKTKRKLVLFFIYPILYIIFSIVHSINGKYLYPMFNPNAVGGWLGVAVCLIVMCFIFTLLYLALLFGVKKKNKAVL